MTRDEVIKGLECHKRAMYGEIDEHGIACNSCPYKDMESTCHMRTDGRVINDALALLKEEPKHGRWEYSPEVDSCVMCTECGHLVEMDWLPMLYCPHCGAEMESEP